MQQEGHRHDDCLNPTHNMLNTTLVFVHVHWPPDKHSNPHTPQPQHSQGPNGDPARYATAQFAGIVQLSMA